MIAFASAARIEAEFDTRRGLGDELRRAELYNRHAREWARYQCRTLGVSLECSQLPGPARGARLIVANHRSPLDIPVLMSVFGGVFLAAEYIAKLPILGPAAREIGTIFVDRDSPHSGARALRAMRGALRAGQTLVAFPEGETHAGDEVHPFRPGAVMVARAKRLEVEVVPVGLAYPPGTEYTGQPLPEYVKMLCEIPRIPITLVAGRSRGLEGARGAILDGLRAEVQVLVDEARARFPTHAARRGGS